MKEIVLRLDEATANDLYWILHSVGAYIAAGAPIPERSTESYKRIAAVMAELHHQFGRMTMAEAMQAALDRRQKSEDSTQP